MLNFTKLHAGHYNLAIEGADILVCKEGASYWCAYLDGTELLAIESTRKDCAKKALAKLGISQLEASKIPAKPHGSKNQAKKPPAIFVNRDSLLVFGMDCANEAFATEHTTKRGKKCAKVDLLQKRELWAWMKMQIPGQTVVIVRGRDREETVVPSPQAQA